MSRVKPLILVGLLLGVSALSISLSAAQESDLAALEQRIQALETRLSNLEKSFAQRVAALERQAREGAQQANPLEGEAQQTYAQISRLAAEGKMDEAKKQMADFMTKYSATNTAKRARRLNAELTVIGKDAPAEWGVEKWYQGESEIDLTSDKATLLVFWEVWCPHCKREVPKMQELYTTLKDQGLQLVGITRITKSATEEKVLGFIDENKITYPILKETGEIASYFSVSGIPAAAVVKGGKVVWRGHPSRLSEEMLKGWL
jgi:thiol-disulfide isomerase/thioredoxin